MNRIEVLDHGYVDLVEVWGSDENIVRAARMSTQKGFEGWGQPEGFVVRLNLTEQTGNPDKPERVSQGWIGDVHFRANDVAWAKRFETEAAARLYIQQFKDSWTPIREGRMKADFLLEPVPAKTGDEKLLRYLWSNRHDTPFEMAGAVLEVQAPIFVFREWHRHRTQSYNEMSARYAPLPDVNYVPTVERLLRGGGHLTKQAGTIADAQQLTPETAELFREALQNGYRAAQFEYEDALKHGVPKELARLVIPVGRYSKMRASANLRNWFGFLTLRNAPNAQWEIQEYARAVESILVERFPRTMEVFRSVER